MTVRVILSDGHRANIATMRHLGCDLERGQFTFIHKDKEVLCMLDAVHMIKVLRNLLGKCEEVVGPHGTARWLDIKNLIKLQVRR